jgi:hypothetical protein
MAGCISNRAQGESPVEANTKANAQCRNAAPDITPSGIQGAPGCGGGRYASAGGGGHRFFLAAPRPALNTQRSTANGPQRASQFPAHLARSTSST